MNRIVSRAGIITLLIAGLLFLTNSAFAMCKCAKGAEQVDPNKKATCSCCCCDCCK